MTSTGQDLPRRAKRKVLRVLLIAVLMLVFVPFGTAAGLLAYMAFKPINVTTVVKPFLPLVLQTDSANPAHKTTLDFQRAELRWSGLRNGFTIPVELSVYNITIQSGTPDLAPGSVKEAQVTLSPLPLIYGKISLRTLNIDGARLDLHRHENGHITLVGQPDSLHHHKKRNQNFLSISAIRHVSLHDTIIHLDDDKTQTQWTLSPAEVRLNIKTQNGKYATTGSASLTVTNRNAPQVELSLTATSTIRAKQPVWHIAIAPVQPSSFSSFVPALNSLSNTVAVTTDVTLISTKYNDWLLPGALDVTTNIGAGQINAGQTSYLVKNATTAVHADLIYNSATAIGAKLSLRSLTAELLDPATPDEPDKGITLLGQGQFEISDLQAPTLLSSHAAIQIPLVDFTRIGAFWPTHAAKGGRLWVMKNITSGTAHNLSVSLDLKSTTGWKGLKPQNLKGGVDATGLTIHWLRPVSPFHDVNARLEVVDLNTLKISFSQGYQVAEIKSPSLSSTGTGRLIIDSGTMIISGLDKEVQTGTINSKIHGNVRDILALLSEPRLHLLSRHPLSFSNPSGNADVSLMISLPLESHVTTDDMTVDAHATLSHVRLENVVLRHSVKNGQFKLEATTKKLVVSGHALAGDQPSDVSYLMNFEKKKPEDIAEKLHLSAHITPETALAAGVVTGGHFDGQAYLLVDYIRSFDKQGTVNLNLDLKPARILIPMWYKAVGQPANISATLHMLDGHLTSVDKLTGEGPELNIHGQINLHPPATPVLKISSFHVGRSSGHAVISLPFLSNDNTIHVNVVASQLDFSPLMGSAFSSSSPSQKKNDDGYSIPTAASGTLHGPPGNAWIIQFQADSLIYNSSKPPLRTINASFVHNGQRLEQLSFSMKAPSPITIQIKPAVKSRHLYVNIPDVGGFLSAFNIIPDVEGGHATLEGTFNDALPAAPFNGLINVSKFSVLRPPGVLITARNLSLYGWIASDKETSFAITHLSVPVSFSDGIITIHDANAGNNALGATMQGNINLQKGNLNINGTIVPLFALNSLLGKLPAIGHLFSPEKNGGLLAVTFNLSGKLKNPDFHINPYSILLPGALRKVLPQ